VLLLIRQRLALNFGDNLLNERHEEFDDPFKGIFLQRILVGGQQTENVGKAVVDGIVFGRKFCKKHLRQIRDPTIFILQTFSHLTKLSFDFDLSRQNQEGESHKTGFFDRRVPVAQPAV